MTRPEIFSFFGLDKIGVVPKPPGHGTQAEKFFMKNIWNDPPPSRRVFQGVGRA
jgi:hypothetical protein